MMPKAEWWDDFNLDTKFEEDKMYENVLNDHHSNTLDWLSINLIVTLPTQLFALFIMQLVNFLQFCESINRLIDHHEFR